MKLYKGFSSLLVEGIHENIFRNKLRPPVDTPPQIHLLADEWFYEKFRIRARSATVICSTNISQAASYAKNGTLAEIIPSNPFSLIYSPSVVDFLSLYTGISQINREAVASWLSGNDYRLVSSQQQLPDCFTEVMVDCASFTLKHVVAPN